MPSAGGGAHTLRLWTGLHAVQDTATDLNKYKLTPEEQVYNNPTHLKDAGDAVWKQFVRTREGHKRAHMPSNTL